MTHSARTPVWTWVVPVLGLLLFIEATATSYGEDFSTHTLGIVNTILLVPMLIGVVFAAVYHAEEVAHIMGEPVGTLVLTVAVTIIELALIISLMLTGKATPTLVRETVFAVIMIVTTGLVGLCIVVGGLRFREQTFDVTSAKIYLAMLIVLATLTLILPNYTTTVPGGLYSESQLSYISIVTIALYLVFLYTQTVLHRGYFVGEHPHTATESPGPAEGKLALSAFFLCVALAAVVLLAKLVAIIINVGVSKLDAPSSISGVIIALIVLMPESIAAVKSARNNQLQKSLNLALGSSLATIGLTIPAIAAANLFLHTPLVLGLEPGDLALIVMTLAASILTFGTGRTNVLFGFLHLVIFGTFLFLSFVP
ncbi:MULTISPECIES: calcium:proton antiporter [unclassified Hyphomicrobium]|uniref:calcium:proton antiporter n=1 Tax=unclassified Hyphomicrobium TaxID=2619925 RepID=UPI000213F802|nr:MULTISPECIES: ionic transporter y4hA [unclassified Hyphomicrobium]CCB63350.1 putative ionic transporter y4hA [Hyphomicrobium sp. MC1]